MPWKHNGFIIKEGKAWSDRYDTQHPSNWAASWSDSEKIAHEMVWEDPPKSYDKRFWEGFLPIMKHFKIKNNNILFAIDCPRDNIWRVEHFPDYKKTRTLSSEIKQKDCNNERHAALFSNDCFEITRLQVRILSFLLFKTNS